MDVATAAAEEVDTGVVPVGTVLAVLVSSRPAAALEEEDKQGEAEVDSEVVVVEVLSPGKGARVRPSRGSVITASNYMDTSKRIVWTCNSRVTEWVWLPTGKSDIAFLDTGASRSIFPEYYHKYVIWSEEINREINQAETGVKLKVHEDAFFRFPFTKKQTGLCMPVHHRAYLMRDRGDGSPSVEPLLRPHKLVLMETAADSWFTIIDAVFGELKEFCIDCPRGDPSCNIPYVVI
uniref:Uncharacterized protein n=1 Tax=Chromera velia CCMP2878 TaxID=1169474 RepID=A0A0G4HLQ7_9ALVE|eukprot:Cvel_28850.t1-p1 / transcript=Cvel_28850.t1 / gene=Cvel_28850 / organism=Chromera_velia_CCMP2878 / gene_product=hypothetical protein / transcript_product=hypothetical protein / location=Cvel_scaffold3850:6579-7423(+) / protein_length=234 / sequence_SO=supercontig / SO=protein_coding / is_pseudo=false